jgi:hypothetical protein
MSYAPRQLRHVEGAEGETESGEAESGGVKLGVEGSVGPHVDTAEARRDVFVA